MKYSTAGGSPSSPSSSNAPSGSGDSVEATNAWNQDINERTAAFFAGHPTPEQIQEFYNDPENQCAPPPGPVEIPKRPEQPKTEPSAPPGSEPKPEANPETPSGSPELLPPPSPGDEPEEEPGEEPKDEPEEEPEEEETAEEYQPISTEEPSPGEDGGGEDGEDGEGEGEDEETGEEDSPQDSNPMNVSASQGPEKLPMPSPAPSGPEQLPMPSEAGGSQGSNSASAAPGAAPSSGAGGENPNPLSGIQQMIQNMFNPAGSGGKPNPEDVATQAINNSTAPMGETSSKDVQSIVDKAMQELANTGGIYNTTQNLKNNITAKDNQWTQGLNDPATQAQTMNEMGQHFNQLGDVYTGIKNATAGDPASAGNSKKSLDNLLNDIMTNTKSFPPFWESLNPGGTGSEGGGSPPTPEQLFSKVGDHFGDMQDMMARPGSGGQKEVLYDSASKPDSAEDRPKMWR